MSCHASLTHDFRRISLFEITCYLKEPMIIESFAAVIRSDTDFPTSMPQRLKALRVLLVSSSLGLPFPTGEADDSADSDVRLYDIFTSKMIEMEELRTLIPAPPSLSLLPSTPESQPVTSDPGAMNLLASIVSSQPYSNSHINLHRDIDPSVALVELKSTNVPPTVKAKTSTRTPLSRNVNAKSDTKRVKLRVKHLRQDTKSDQENEAPRKKFKRMTSPVSAPHVKAPPTRIEFQRNLMHLVSRYFNYNSNPVLIRYYCVHLQHA